MRNYAIQKVTYVLPCKAIDSLCIGMINAFNLCREYETTSYSCYAQIISKLHSLLQIRGKHKALFSNHNHIAGDYVEK